MPFYAYLLKDKAQVQLMHFPPSYWRVGHKERVGHKGRVGIQEFETSAVECTLWSPSPTSYLKPELNHDGNWANQDKTFIWEKGTPPRFEKIPK